MLNNEVGTGAGSSLKLDPHLDRTGWVGSTSTWVGLELDPNPLALNQLYLRLECRGDFEIQGLQDDFDFRNFGCRH